MDNYWKDKFHNAMDIVKQLRSKIMETKQWYESKTVQGVIIICIASVVLALGDGNWAQACVSIGTALSIVGLRMANTQIK